MGTTIHGYEVSDVVYLDPNALPELVVITKEQAERIAATLPTKDIVVTEVRK